MAKLVFVRFLSSKSAETQYGPPTPLQGIFFYKNTRHFYQPQGWSTRAVGFSVNEEDLKLWTSVTFFRLPRNLLGLVSPWPPQPVSKARPVRLVSLTGRFPGAPQDLPHLVSQARPVRRCCCLCFVLFFLVSHSFAPWDHKYS